jgi:hypothetical protein
VRLTKNSITKSIILPMLGRQLFAVSTGASASNISPCSPIEPHILTTQATFDIENERWESETPAVQPHVRVHSCDADAMYGPTAKNISDKLISLQPPTKSSRCLPPTPHGQVIRSKTAKQSPPKWQKRRENPDGMVPGARAALFRPACGLRVSNFSTPAVSFIPFSL